MKSVTVAETNLYLKDIGQNKTIKGDNLETLLHNLRNKSHGDVEGMVPG